MTTDKPRDPAEVAAEKIWVDMTDRRGFGLKVLRYDDPETFTDIQVVHAQLVREANAEQTAELERLRKELDEQTKRAKQIQAKKCLRFWMNL